MAASPTPATSGPVGAIGHAIVPSRLEPAIELHLAGGCSGPATKRQRSRGITTPSSQKRSRTVRTSVGLSGFSRRVDHGRTARGIVDEEHFGRPLVDHDLDAEPIVRHPPAGCAGGASMPKQRGGDVELPSDPHQRVTVLHEQAITEIAVGGRIVARPPRLNRPNRTHDAAVRDFEEQDAVALRRIRRSKHVQIGREAHAAIGITSRMIEIDDADVVRIGRIQRELDAADEPLVWPGGSEGLPTRHSRSRRDGDARDLGGRRATDERAGTERRR